MLARTRWISDQEYNGIPRSLRDNVREALGGKKELHHRYVSNVENALRNRGENELANELLDWFNIPDDEIEAFDFYYQRD